MPSALPLPKIALALLAFSLAAAAQEPSPSPQPAPPPTDPTKGSPPAQEAPFDIPVPEGEPVKGIKVPYYSEDTQEPVALLEAGLARRLDERRVEIEDLKVDAISDEDGTRLFVQMPKAVFDMETRLLSGTEGVIIRREDFEIEGRQGEFDLRKRFGRVRGDVKMTIYTTDNQP